MQIYAPLKMNAVASDAFFLKDDFPLLEQILDKSSCSTAYVATTGYLRHYQIGSSKQIRDENRH